jgi:hypothetical protein
MVRVTLAAFAAASCASCTPFRHKSGGAHPSASVAAALALRWQRAEPDSSLLKALVDETTQRGETGMRILLEVVLDSMRPATVRLYSLWGLEGYWGRWGDCLHPFPYDGRHPMGLVTIVCTSDESVPPPRVSAEMRMLSVSPALRDSVRKQLETITGERGRVGATVAQHLAAYARVERWHAETRRICSAYVSARQAAVEMYGGQLPVLLENVDLLDRCTSSAPPIIAGMWPTAESDSASLAVVAGLSLKIRDQRIYDAVLLTALDPRRSEDVRVAATLVLGAQVHEGLVRPVIAELKHGQWRSFNCQMPDSEYPQRAQEEGSRPLGADAMRSAERDLRRLAGQTDSDVVQAAATEVSRCLRRVGQPGRT